MTWFLWGVVAWARRRFHRPARQRRRDWRNRPLTDETAGPRFVALRAPRPRRP
jgi:hypothetical protein